MEITFREKLIYLIAALCGSGSFIYIMMYCVRSYETQLGLSAQLLFVLLCATKLISGSLDFVIGLSIDRTRSRYGKYKPLLLAGTLLFGGLAAAHLLCLPHSTPTASIASYIGLCVFYALTEVAFWSMLPSFGSGTQTRETMSVAARLGSFIGYETAVLLSMYAAYNLGSAAFFSPAPAWICLLAFILSQLLLLSCITDRSLHYNQSSALSPWQLIKIFLANDQLHIVSLIIFMLQFAYYASLFAVSSWVNSSAQPAYYFLTSSVASTLGGLSAFAVYNPLRLKLPRKTIFLSACAACGVGQLLIILSVFSTLSILLYGGLSLLFGGLSWLSVCTVVMLSNTVDYGEFRSNIRIEGLSMSMLTVSTKAAISVGMLTSYAVMAHTPESGPLPALTISLGPLAGIVCVALVVFTYLSLYKLKGSFYIHMLNTLDRLRDIGNKNDLNYTSVRYALDERSILMHMEDDNLDSILTRLTESITETHAIGDPGIFREDLLSRLQSGPCGIADGIAIAHAKSGAVQRPALAIATLNHAIDCGAIDGQRCDLIFLIASPADANAHLNLLGKLSLILNESELCNDLRVAGSSSEIIERIFICEKYLMLRNF